MYVVADTIFGLVSLHLPSINYSSRNFVNIEPR